jgi:hypothetical protein
MRPCGVVAKGDGGTTDAGNTDGGDAGPKNCGCPVDTSKGEYVAVTDDGGTLNGCGDTSRSCGYRTCTVAVPPADAKELEDAGLKVLAFWEIRSCYMQ